MTSVGYTNIRSDDRPALENISVEIEEHKPVSQRDTYKSKSIMQLMRSIETNAGSNCYSSRIFILINYIITQDQI